MAMVMNYLQSFWPFSAFKFDDIRASDGIVSKLQIPKSVKQFVYAIRNPESHGVVYVLSVQNLSERSAHDAECLIRAIKPDAVVAQVGGFNTVGNGEEHTGLFSVLKDMKDTGNEKRDDMAEQTVPTSSFEVLKRCFMYKLNKDVYENVAGSSVLREIFGVDFDGHFLTAKKVADEIGSSFFIVKSPFIECGIDGDNGCDLGSGPGQLESGNGFRGGFGFQMSSLVPGRMGSPAVPLISRGLCHLNDVQRQMVKSLSTSLIHSSSDSKTGNEDVQPRANFEVPQFAGSVYPLLVDLHDIFVDIPAMGRALACAQKILCDVNKGEFIDSQLLSEVYVFRIAVEGLRIVLNNAGRLPMSKIGKPIHHETEFSELSLEDKSHSLLAQALQCQAKKFKSIVAIVDASALAGLRKHWKTPVPPEVKDMVGELLTECGNLGEMSDNSRKRLLTDKPMVAVGAGATAILGASSLSKVVPASSLIKVVTLQVPASLKLMFTHTHKAFLYALGKALGPTKAVAPGMASSAFKSSTTLKAAASAEKIRALTHSFIASAEKTSLSAMRTSFYEIMRKRRVRPIGGLPLATFGCSIVTCAGLLVYGDGIECAAESLPAAPSIANLGRGIQSLHQASQAVKEKENFWIQKSIESLLYRFKKTKIQ